MAAQSGTGQFAVGARIIDNDLDLSTLPIDILGEEIPKVKGSRPIKAGPIEWRWMERTGLLQGKFCGAEKQRVVEMVLSDARAST